MLRGFFDYDNPVWRFIGRFADMVILNLLLIICSIPVFTFGAALTAVYYCSFKIVRNEDYGTVKMFFKSFRLNFRQATVIWLIMAGIGAVLAVDLYVFHRIMSGNSGIIIQGIVGAMILLWIFIFLYVWPLLSRFDNTIRNTLTNAVYMSLRYIGSTLSMLITDLVILFVLYLLLFYYPAITAFCLLMGLPVFCWINAGVLDHIFEKYMPVAENRENTAVNPILEDVNVDGSVKEGAEETARAIRELRIERERDQETEAGE